MLPHSTGRPPPPGAIASANVEFPHVWFVDLDQWPGVVNE